MIRLFTGSNRNDKLCPFLFNWYGAVESCAKHVNFTASFSVTTISKIENGSESWRSAEPVPPSVSLFCRNLFFGRVGVVLVPEGRASSPG